MEREKVRCEKGGGGGGGGGKDGMIGRAERKAGLQMDENQR